MRSSEQPRPDTGPPERRHPGGDTEDAAFDAIGEKRRLPAGLTPAPFP